MEGWSFACIQHSVPRFPKGKIQMRPLVLAAAFARFLSRAMATLLVTITVPVAAATYTWTGADNATWSTNTNWSPSGTPTIADTVVFGSGTGGTNVTLSASGTAGSTVINRNTTFLGSQLTTGTSLTVANNVNVSFQNWQITGTSGISANSIGSGATITVNGLATQATAGSITLNSNSLLSFASQVNFARNNPIGGSGTVAWAATSGSNGGGQAFRFNLSDTVTFRINSDAAATSGISQSNVIVSSGTNTVLLQRNFDFMTPTTTGTSGILGLGYARTIASPGNPSQRNASLSIAGAYTLSANLLGVTFLSGTQTLLIDSGTVQIGDGSAGKAQGVYTTNGSTAGTIFYGVANSSTSTLEVGGAASAGTLRVNANSSFNATTDASGSNSLGYQLSVLGTSTLVNNGAWTNRNFKDQTIYTGLNIGSSAKLSGTGSFDMTTGYTGVGATGIGKAVSVSGIVAPGDVGNGVNGVGTLTISSGTVSFGAASQVAISGSGATLDRLVLNAPVSVTSGAKIDFAGASSLTQGRYQVVTGSSGVNTFTAANAPSAYSFGTSGTDAYLWAKPVFGTISTTPAAAQVITGGTVAFTYAVQNASPTGGQDLAFTSAAGSGIVGAVSGPTTVAPQATSGSVSGFSYVGGTPGLAQAATFTVSDPNAFATSATGTVALNVLDHATPGFATAAGLAVLNPLTTGTILLDFGSVDVSAGAQSRTYSLTNLASQTYGASLTAGLALTAFTGNGDGFTSGLSSFADLLAGGTSSLFTAQFTPSTEGSFNRSYTLTFYDNQSVAGSTQQRDLTVTMQAVVVPEPGALVLASVGVILAGWSLARRRVS
jgi:hypothetical protein